jgi:hypothetical protein
MKSKLIPILFSALIITSCGGLTEKPKTPEELKLELLMLEQSSPLSYLEADATMREDKVKTRNAGLFRDAEYSPDGNTIYGTIKNSATVAKFKDVVLAVTFYSQTDTPIETKDFTIYEFYAPNTVNNFELKVYPPEAMAKFGIKIKNATAVY